MICGVTVRFLWIRSWNTVYTRTYPTLAIVTITNDTLIHNTFTYTRITVLNSYCYAINQCILSIVFHATYHSLNNFETALLIENCRKLNQKITVLDYFLTESYDFFITKYILEDKIKAKAEVCFTFQRNMPSKLNICVQFKLINNDFIIEFQGTTEVFEVWRWYESDLKNVELKTRNICTNQSEQNKKIIVIDVGNAICDHLNVPGNV